MKKPNPEFIMLTVAICRDSHAKELARLSREDTSKMSLSEKREHLSKKLMLCGAISAYEHVLYLFEEGKEEKGHGE